MIVTVPALPTPAYRLSWLAQRLEFVTRQLFFESLLQQVAPDSVPHVSRPDRDPLAAYNALVDYINRHLFPVWTGVEFGWADEEGALADVQEAIYYGIPVETWGYDLDAIQDERGSPCLALMFVCTHWGEYPLDEMHSLRAHQRALKPHLTPWPVPAGQVTKNTRPPRGRAWRGAWQGLPDLRDYMTAYTGNNFLDFSPQDIAEMDGNPPWHIEEIRGLAAHWATAKPIWARIENLRAHIDADPARRLPQLLAVLAGDTVTRHCLSRPKAGRIK